MTVWQHCEPENTVCTNMILGMQSLGDAIVINFGNNVILTDLISDYPQQMP